MRYFLLLIVFLAISLPIFFLLINSEKKGQLRLSTRYLLFLFIVTLPVIVLVNNYSAGQGWLRLINFGQVFQNRALPEVKKLSPPIHSSYGYDGQFYAQVAVDPFLTRKEELTVALDSTFSRPKRIVLPFLAYILGFGQPKLIFHIYALLNFIFWLILFFFLYQRTRFYAARDVLLTIAIVWALGIYASLVRALTDLPALVFSMAILFDCRWGRSIVSFAAGVLCRETVLLSLPALISSSRRTFKEYTLALATIILPIVLWVIYVWWRLGPLSLSLIKTSFLLPGAGFFRAVGGEWKNFLNTPTIYCGEYLLNILVLFSFAVQIIYLLLNPRMKSVFYRFGIGFAVLGVFINSWMYFFDYTRMLLPLTFAFNFLIYEHEAGWRFKILYLVGNVSIFATICCVLIGIR